MADKSSETTHLIANQPYDESVSVYDDEEVTSLVSPSPRAALPGKKTNDPMGDREHLLGSDDDNEFEHDDGDFSPRQPVENGGQNIKPAQQKQRPAPSQNQRQPSASSRSRPPPGGHVIEASDDDDDDDDDGDQSESSEDEDGKVATTEGTYDPAEYEHLPVSQEIKELFQYITRYTPQAIDLDYKLRPFIPDYIPAVGDIDAFLKVARPDGKPETLGLFLLDEPSAKQSDPTVLDLQLRSISKQTNVKQVVVRSIDEPGKNPKAIDNWITSITDLHRQKPPQNVHYTKKMPDIETLMQEWPPEFEELLKTANLPSAELDCDLVEYIDIICSILDIPIYKNRIQSLHILFTLYSEFKNSQHFNQLANNNLLSNELKQHDPMSRKAKSENTESLSFD